jgi:protein-disulfide isomerase
MRAWVDWLLTALRVLLGLVLVYAGAIKFVDPLQTVRAVRAYHLLPEPLVIAMAYGLPVLEITLGLLLVVGLDTRLVVGLSALRLLFFTAGIISVWARGLQIDCGCFGGGGFSESTSYTWDIVRNVLLLAACVVLFIWPPGHLSLDSKFGQPTIKTQGVILALVMVVVGAGALVQVARVGWSDPAAGIPQGVVETYGIPRGDADAPVTVTVYEDFQCPFCAHLEAHAENLLADEVDKGNVRVVYRPVAFLDDASTTDYSSRAQNAAACVQDLGGEEAFVEMHTSLFAEQPAEGSAGLSNERLTELAVDAGVSRLVARACISRMRFEEWGRDATDQASKDGVAVLPHVLVNGEKVEFTGHEVPEVTLQRLIDEAVDRAAGS